MSIQTDTKFLRLPFNDITGWLKYPKRIINFTNTVVHKTRLVMARPDMHPDMHQRLLRNLSSSSRGEPKFAKR